MVNSNELEVMGYRINPKSVKNPAIRRVIRGRVCEEFLFKALFSGHDDHSEYNKYSEKKYSESSSHRDSNSPNYGDHSEKYSDHEDKYSDQYSCD